MHVYICPYCDPCKEARMIKTTPKIVPPEKKGLFGRKTPRQTPGQKCKEIMRCQKCKNEFSITKKFLKDHRRKIKDG